MGFVDDWGIDTLNAVVVYDHNAKTMTHMSYMLEEKTQQGLVSIWNKLFVIEKLQTGEIYDKVTNKLTIIIPAITITTYRAV